MGLVVSVIMGLVFEEHTPIKHATTRDELLFSHAIKNSSNQNTKYKS